MGQPRTRRQRSLHYGLLIGVVCGILIAPFWASTSHRWQSWTFQSVNQTQNIGVSTRSFGLVPYLVVVEDDVSVNGVPGPTYTWSMTWRPWRLTGLIVSSLLILWLAKRVHGRLVERSRLRGYCDDCGYDVSAVRSERCPECGADLDPTHTRA